MVLQQKESVEGMTGQKKNLWNHYKNDYKCEDECSGFLKVHLDAPTRFCFCTNHWVLSGSLMQLQVRRDLFDF